MLIEHNYALSNCASLAVIIIFLNYYKKLLTILTFTFSGQSNASHKSIICLPARIFQRLLGPRVMVSEERENGNRILKVEPLN